MNNSHLTTHFHHRRARRHQWYHFRTNSLREAASMFLDHRHKRKTQEARRRKQSSSTRLTVALHKESDPRFIHTQSYESLHASDDHLSSSHSNGRHGFALDVTPKSHPEPPSRLFAHRHRKGWSSTATDSRPCHDGRTQQRIEGNNQQAK